MNRLIAGRPHGPHLAFLVAAVVCIPAGCQQPAQAPPPNNLDAMTIFSSNCSTRSCHGVEGRKGGLQLTPDVAYDQLVDVPASNDVALGRKKRRVVPGDPAGSFLFQKITAPAADEGNLMPQRAASLDAASIEAIRLWILNGAPRGGTVPLKFEVGR